MSDNTSDTPVTTTADTPAAAVTQSTASAQSEVAPIPDTVMEMPAPGVSLSPDEQAAPPHKSTLGATLAVSATVLLMGLSGIYWFVNQSAVDETLVSNAPVKSKTATSTNSSAASTSSSSTISATPTSTGATTSDIDSEVKSLDASISAVTTSDFDSATLADTSLGL